MTDILTAGDFRAGESLWPDIVLSANDVSSDTRIETEIAAARETFEAEVGETFGLTTAATLTFDGSGASALVTHGYRLLDVDTVTIVSPDGTTSELDADYWRVEPWGIQRTDGGTFPAASTVELGGVDHGWTTCPADVRRAVALLVYDALKPGNPLRQRAMSWEAGDIRYSRALTKPFGIPEVDAVVARYRHPRIGAV